MDTILKSDTSSAIAEVGNLSTAPTNELYRESMRPLSDCLSGCREMYLGMASICDQLSSLHLFTIQAVPHHRSNGTMVGSTCYAPFITNVQMQVQ